VIFVSLVIPIA